jgi:hypothetical protein
MLNAVAASFSAFGKSIGPIQANVAKTLSVASNQVSLKVNEAVVSISDPAKKEAVASIEKPNCRFSKSNIQKCFKLVYFKILGNQIHF